MISFVSVLVSIGLGLFATVWSDLGLMSFYDGYEMDGKQQNARI